MGNFFWSSIEIHWRGHNYILKRTNNQVYIYFISNEPIYRTEDVQLDLTCQEIRGKYINLLASDPKRLKHRVLRGKNWIWMWDVSAEAREILVRKEIPAERIIGRCALSDLICRCDLTWLTEKLETSSNYREAINSLQSHANLSRNISLSAKAIPAFCFDQFGDTSSVVTPSIVSDLLYYAINCGSRSDGK